MIGPPTDLSSLQRLVALVALFSRDHTTNTPARLLYIAFSSRDQMYMHVKERLTRIRTCIYPDIETGNGRIAPKNGAAFFCPAARPVA